MAKSNPEAMKRAYENDLTKFNIWLEKELEGAYKKIDNIKNISEKKMDVAKTQEAIEKIRIKKNRDIKKVEHEIEVLIHDREKMYCRQKNISVFEMKKYGETSHIIKGQTLPSFSSTGRQEIQTQSKFIRVRKESPLFFDTIIREFGKNDKDLTYTDIMKMCKNDMKNIGSDDIIHFLQALKSIPLIINKVRTPMRKYNGEQIDMFIQSVSQGRFNPNQMKKITGKKSMKVYDSVRQQAKAELNKRIEKQKRQQLAAWEQTTGLKW